MKNGRGCAIPNFGRQDGLSTCLILETSQRAGVLRIMRVLLADSNDVQLMGHQLYLRRRGLQVFTASDGLECLTKLREHRPDEAPAPPCSGVSHEGHAVPGAELPLRVAGVTGRTDQRRSAEVGRGWCARVHDCVSMGSTEGVVHGP